LRPETAQQAVQDLGLTNVTVTDDLDRAIAELKPDFLVDVTIPEAHHDVTIKALRAGIPVIGEKPMATSMEHARQMVATSEPTGVLYMVSQSRRYHAQLHALRHLIQNQLGGLGILNSDFYIGAHFGGFRDQMPSPLVL